MTTFGTLNTAMRGLMASQQAMAVTGQNITNANTEGYSRQRVELVADGGDVSRGMFSGNQPAFNGVTVAGINRVKDAFLEAMRVAAGARQSALTQQTTTLDAAQRILSEPSATGLSNTLNAFYASWHDLANAPVTASNQAAGSVVLQRSQAVTDQLHGLSTRISQQWDTTYNSLKTTVAETNQALSDLAGLNGQIHAGYLMGQSINDLLDKRDTLIRNITQRVGGSAVIGSDETATVTVAGITVLHDTNASTLTLSGGTTIGDIAVANPPKILWSGTQMAIDGGTAAGDLASLKSDLPGMSTKLDGVANALIQAVNSLHTTGYAADGTTGKPFFSGTGAGDIAVVPTAATAIAYSNAAGTLDVSVANAIGDLMDDAKSSAALSGGLGATAQWRQLVTGTGVQVQSLKQAVAAQDAVVAAADDSVQADSGVSLDEEMANMVQFQRSYQASARLITTVDEMLDTLVNKTGLVGR